MSIWATWTRGEELSHRSASAGRSSRASLGRLQRFRQNLAAHQRQGEVVGIYLKEFLEQLVGLVGVAVLVVHGRVKSGELRGPREASRASRSSLRRPRSSLALLNQDGEILRTRPTLPAGSQPIDP